MVTQGEIGWVDRPGSTAHRGQAVSQPRAEALAQVMEELAQEHGPLVARLQTFGQQPVADAVQRRHLAALERVRLEPVLPQPGSLEAVTAGYRRIRTVAAAMVAGLLGASGLAVAGALPDPAQKFAADALGVLGLDVPRSTDSCDDIDEGSSASDAATCDDAASDD